MSDSQLFILSFLGLLLSAGYYLHEGHTSEETKVVPKQLAVLVLSRLEHTDQRRAIRETWARTAARYGAKLVFGMGEAACHLPKLWRARPNFCTEWKLKVPAWIDDTVPFLLPEDDRSSSKGQGASYQGFTFTVRSFPILVEALGLHIPLLKNLATKSNSSEITVELTDSVSKQLIYHVSFNQSDLKTTKREAGYLYKDLKNRHLPLENFEGHLSLRFSSPDMPRVPRRCSVTYGEDFGVMGLIETTGLLQSHNSATLPFSKYACPLVSLQYSVLDPDTLKRLHRSKNQQIEMERLANKDLRKRANLEEEEYGDMIFLPVVDSNETDSDNFKHSSSHTLEHLDFNNLLLVNDETYVFFENVIAQLNLHESSNLWWSDFNSISGSQYQSISVPPLIIPKNLAMILSRDLVKYVAHNANYLRSFSSLLTSLGIWFSSLDRKLVNDHQWSKKLPNNPKDFRVDDAALAFQGVSPKAMRQIWKQNLPQAMTNSNS